MLDHSSHASTTLGYSRSGPGNEMRLNGSLVLMIANGRVRSSGHRGEITVPPP